MSSAVVVASARVSSASRRSSRTASAVTCRRAVRLVSAVSSRRSSPVPASRWWYATSGRKSSAVRATRTALTNWRGPRARSRGSPVSAGDVCLAHKSAIRAAWAARKSLNCRVTPLKSRGTRRQSRERGILDGGDLDRELHRGAAAPAVTRPEHGAEHGERDHLQIDEYRDRARVRDRDPAVGEQGDQDPFAKAEP